MPRALNSATIVGGISRHPQALACATCHFTRWSSVALRGIGCVSCHAAFTVGIDFSLKSPARNRARRRDGEEVPEGQHAEQRTT
jgi:hypothetical protein